MLRQFFSRMPRRLFHAGRVAVVSASLLALAVPAHAMDDDKARLAQSEWSQLLQQTEARARARAGYYQPVVLDHDANRSAAGRTARIGQDDEKQLFAHLWLDVRDDTGALVNPRYLREFYDLFVTGAAGVSPLVRGSGASDLLGGGGLLPHSPVPALSMVIPPDVDRPVEYGIYRFLALDSPVWGEKQHQIPRTGIDPHAFRLFFLMHELLGHGADWKYFEEAVDPASSRARAVRARVGAEVYADVVATLVLARQGFARDAEIIAKMREARLGHVAPARSRSIAKLAAAYISAPAMREALARVAESPEIFAGMSDAGLMEEARRITAAALPTRGEWAGLVFWIQNGGEGEVRFMDPRADARAAIEALYANGSYDWSVSARIFPDRGLVADFMDRLRGKARDMGAVAFHDYLIGRLDQQRRNLDALGPDAARHERVRLLSERRATARMLGVHRAEWQAMQARPH